MSDYIIIIASPETTIISPILPGDTAAETIARFDPSGLLPSAEFLYTDFDPASYVYPRAFTLVGGVVGFDLPTAKTLAGLKAKANTTTKQKAALSGYSSEVLAAQAILAEGSRTPEIQTALESVNTLNDDLQADIVLINAAASINEVNNIVNLPFGTIFTGRGSGLGPEDLNVSYYTSFNSPSMAESETELYVPSVDAVIAYGSGGAVPLYPNTFDSMGDVFNVGGPYDIQIRETATGKVIAEFEVPLNENGEIVEFNIPDPILGAPVL